MLNYNVYVVLLNLLTQDVPEMFHLSPSSFNPIEPTARAPSGQQRPTGSLEPKPHTVKLIGATDGRCCPTFEPVYKLYHVIRSYKML